MACVTANLPVLHKTNPVAHSSRLHRLPTVLRFAPSQSDVVCSFTGINHGERPPKSHCCEIKTVHSLMERTSADVCLKKSLGSYIKQTLNIMSWCTVTIAIPNVVTVETRMFLCSTGLSVPPRHKWCSVPLCGPYLVTSNISSINKGNTKYNGQCSKKEPFATTSRQIRQIGKALHTTISSSQKRQEWLGSRTGPSPWNFV